MNLYRYLLISILLSSFMVSGYTQGHHIEISLINNTDSQIYLAYHYGDKQFVKDTLPVSREGKVIVAGDVPLEGGVYLVVLPSMRYFEILIDKDQHFSVEVDINDFLGSMKYAGSAENEAFLSYQKYLKDCRPPITPVCPPDFCSVLARSLP